MKKRYKYSLTLLVLFVLGTWYGCHHIFPYAIIKPYKAINNIQAQDFNLKTSELNVITKDSLSLKGLFIQTPLPEKGIIILVHGIGSCKEHQFPLAEKLSNQGYSSYVFDGRAHGKSEGEYCTFGFYEKQDISSIVTLLKNNNPNTPIGIWGHSLGGAIAIQSLAIDKRIEFGIIESTFTDVNQVVFDYKKRILKGIGIRWLSNYILENAAKIAQFSPEKTKPINDVRNISQPILFTHGDADDRISIQYGKDLFNNCSSKTKNFITVPEAGHNTLHYIGGKKYFHKVFSFLQKNTTKEH
ncbi:alpha/beta hydrolase [Pseudofulvibacter geojedonensis]|uniref:Alpha/beta hydrolase n=1 Tax=Pseudofulvibacter geojedonensis TaxID=1123758 RepID=A0ABW3I6G4_9FLAO